MISTSGCKKEQQVATTEPPAVLGKRLFMQYCISCHNADPKIDGMVGPANYGSSLELLKAKVLKNEYPPGYTPKRSTRLMIPITTLKENELEALHAFLNQ